MQKVFFMQNKSHSPIKIRKWWNHSAGQVPFVERELFKCFRSASYNFNSFSDFRFPEPAVWF